MEPGATVQAPPEAIRAFDRDGREVMVPREEWRTNVLPGALKELWDRPDELYSFILNSLNDGFVADVTEASAHLQAIDPVAERGTCLWAIVLLAGGRLDEAEAVLDQFTAEHGEHGAVLINLAKVYVSRDQAERADRTLWRGLELEPNLENGLGWFAARAADRGGESAAEEALQRVAALPNSWRAQSWLARAELARGDLAGALPLYRTAIERAGRPVPGDLLMSISGDLGNAGYLRELLELTAPHFDPALHGLPVGNNLIKAYVDTGDLQTAAGIVGALEAFSRPDWRAPLEFWSAEIARRRSGLESSGGDAAAPLEIGMLRVDGPIWLPPGSPARAIFGAKAAGAPTVTFLGGTAEVASVPGQGAPAMSDAVGRMSRALPLFFAEQTELRTAAVGRALLPWATGGRSGFVVSGAPWPDATGLEAVGAGQEGANANAAAQNGAAQNRSEYVVTVHLDARAEPWTSELVFLRASDGARLGELDAEWMPDRPEKGLLSLADEVVDLLSALGEPRLPGAYRLPEAPRLGAYLLRLEQLLAVRCAGMPGVPAHFLTGEPEILGGNLELCRAEPTCVPARLLFLETLGAMGAIRPEIAERFREPFLLLAAEAPLAEVDRAFSSGAGDRPAA